MRHHNVDLAQELLGRKGKASVYHQASDATVMHISASPDGASRSLGRAALQLHALCDVSRLLRQCAPIRVPL